MSTAQSESVVLRAVEPLDVDELRSALADAFAAVQAAIGAGSPVVVVVPSEDLLGHRLPEQAAYVGALVGMIRAIAFEGARAGWRINGLAVMSSQTITDDEAVEAVAAAGLSGQVLTLGTALVGKVVP